ncbi:MFS transporter [Cytobacillus purgationiresistens]|uniref:MFS family arabinose efflux permease n=1 Tax=Cytobacillus purgationiresistens TaxID=863449 RepID=A0ABU0AJE6_9BACI|nr:MFS transporter [Cytobacillus purgationiresistens]MDQ0271155.1 putative MFS family arabinose efflux permease [Cytobacillus purgationiresistens]
MSDISHTQVSNPKLPLISLLALSMAGFICIMTETVPAGLLPHISNGLNVSTPLAGQLVTLYAIGSLVAAIPVTFATQSWKRKPLLLFAIGLFFIFNTITAFSSNYTLTLVARFFAGVGAGIVWSMLTGYARRMVAPELKGRATAIAMVGTPIALSLGVPIGTILGESFGWRAVFIIMSILTFILIIWIIVKVPDFLGNSSGNQVSIYKVFTIPGVRPILSVVILWMIAHNILYTYIAPFLVEMNLGTKVGISLFIFGGLSLIGIWVTGVLIDKKLRLLVLLSLIGFSLSTLLFQFSGGYTISIFIGIALWGITFGGAATLLQTALAQSVGEKNVDTAMSMNTTVWNAAIAGGGIIGGILLDSFGSISFPLTILILTVLAIVIVVSNKKHAFVKQ